MLRLTRERDAAERVGERRLERVVGERVEERVDGAVGVREGGKELEHVHLVRRERDGHANHHVHLQQSRNASECDSVWLYARSRFSNKYLLARLATSPARAFMFLHHLPGTLYLHTFAHSVFERQLGLKFHLFPSAFILCQRFRFVSQFWRLMLCTVYARAYVHEYILLRQTFSPTVM